MDKIHRKEKGGFEADAVTDLVQRSPVRQGDELSNQLGRMS
jgi:hypothetical protein